MKIRPYIRRFTAGAVAVLALSLIGVVTAPVASASAAGNAATLAAANIGKSAGTCADTPTYNTLGGSEFTNSCSGGGELWCADFAMWAWANSGLSTTGLTAAACSFYVYGQNNGTLHTSTTYVPQPGDAIVYDYTGDGVADHVAIVTAVNSDGSVVTANGDFGGTPNSSNQVFSDTSSVVSATISESQRSVGSEPSTVDPADGFHISAYVSPVAAGANPYTPTQICGSGYGVVDSHSLGSATVYLLYNNTTGDNCVTTLATTPTTAVAMNATLSVLGGSSASNPGTFTDYAGPVVENAPSSCIEWGGTYQTTTWTSGWSHC